MVLEHIWTRNDVNDLVNAKGRNYKKLKDLRDGCS
ncbi:hypothetical protein LINPERPRIM_LOCUS16182 [Linum perenne]